MGDPMEINDDHGHIFPIPYPQDPQFPEFHPIPENQEPYIIMPYQGYQLIRIVAKPDFLIQSIALYDHSTMTNVQTWEGQEITDLFQMDIELQNITQDYELIVNFIDGRSNVYMTVGDGNNNDQGSITLPELTEPAQYIDVSYNSSQTFLITPNPGFKIQSVSITQNDTTTVLTATDIDPFYVEHTISGITSDVTINALFEEYRPSIYALAEGELDPQGNLLPAQGTISPDEEQDYPYGSEQTYTITANEGYKISSIRVNEVSQTFLNGREVSYTFTDLTSDQTIKVAFSELPHKINVTSVGSGSITLDTASVDTGDDLDIPITAEAGFVIDKISINGVIQSVTGQPTTKVLSLLDINEDKNITVYFAESSFESGDAFASSEWSTIHTRYFDDMVVVATPVLTLENPASATLNVCIRIKNVTNTSFEVKVQRLDNNNSPVAEIPFTYFIANAGVYNVEDHGIKMEAVKFTSTTTDRKRSWKGEARNYLQSYDSPIVFGQVMSAEDDMWSVFWSSGNKHNNPATADFLEVGKHVGEDTITEREPEDIGYLVIESGSHIFNGHSLQALLSSDSIDGVNNSGQDINGLADNATVITTQAAMDGGDGGFAVLLNSKSTQNGTIKVAINEDQFGDSERSHTKEQVSLLTIAPLTTSSAINDSFTLTENAATGNVIANDFIKEEVTITVSDSTLTGLLDFNDDGSFVYTSISSEIENFQYELRNSDGEVISTGLVTITP